ncbi:CD27 antigen isoform X1 [Megalobrama amblycephala]|uniref:CD27 antigen isoform X1 n=1 Tax=Megalobrama amblycephala TaxID=75352 RepID=UPI002013EFD0|nr:CD27 antigen isoform X1 [Megalobrama amblycephala]XP_048010260.1 CD27 antigen isoform X1 [Megalobrama amblycephala]XP_048010261.1 CD27 antigen isoform X1 [Megalobrama amblycephala]XP_048010262.1 CD27 antigen isoform X1 [Megalobrama amblycephala]XP_048010263.1 CD27 antigen isoform X1 [Megalobrama amblycephala]
MFALLSVLLLSSQVLPLVQSETCNETTEYLEVSQCCKKCEPGQLLVERCKPGSPDTQCKPCGKGFFMEDYNTNFGWCNYCKKCTKDHMKYNKTCTLTSDAVCTCDEGYRCSGDKCETCVKVPTTTLSHTSPTTAPTTSTKKILPTHDNVWISVSLCFACVCVCVLFTCFLLTSRHARSCGRIMSASKGFWFYKKSNSGISQCTEKDKMPVQEMCGKTEKMEDV